MNTQDSPHKFNSFSELLISFTEEMPKEPALIYENSGEPVSMSRDDFAAAVFERADQLRGSGKTCIGVLCDGSLECIITIFGAAVSHIQTVLLDESASDELLQEQIRQTDIDALFGGDEDLLFDLTPYLTKGLSRRDEGGGGRILFFTSGTTSSSKAVVLTDQSLMAAAYNGSCKLPLHDGDKLMCMLPLNHVFGFVCGLLWGMECGVPVALGRGARYYAQDLSFFRPTVLSAVPLLLGFLVQYRLINREMRLLLIGAGDCPDRLIRSVMQSGLQVSFGYGLTETSSGVAISVPDGPSSDPYALEICPEDTVTLAEDGEILIASDSCMMQGYYHHPEDTAAVLIDGVLHTGDLGRWDESGRLHIIGRKKEILVLSDGTKLFLPEYEARIAAALPGRDFAVLERNGKPVLLLVDKEAPGWTDQIMEEAAKILVQQELRGVMAELPRGHQLSDIVFTDKPLPRTVTGKVRRWGLRLT